MHVARWRVAPRTKLRWRVLDGDPLVYHEPSGDTHWLQPLAARALRALERRAASADELAADLAPDLGLSHNAELVAQIDDLLARFDELGLIEPADDPERAVEERGR